MTRVWNIPGGVHPPENKQQSLQLPLGEVSLPKELVFPLSQHIGVPADPLVKAGDRVRAGEKIAAAHGIFSAPIHASTSGTVTAIEDRVLPHPSGMEGECIVLEPDGLDEHVEYQGCEDYRNLKHAALVQKIRDAGLTGLGGASFPTAVKLNPKSNQPIDTLILNGTECEPYITSDDMLMRTRADDIVRGAQLFAHILGNPERVVIGVEDNKPEAIEALLAATKGTDIELATFPTKYPSGGEKQLIQILTNREVPSEKLPADIGVIVQNVGTAVAAWEAVRYGRPLITRITTVVGEALETQRNVLVRLGTPISHILQEHGFQAEQTSRLILGGPMMGFAPATAAVPVVKATNCIMAPSDEELPLPPPAQACIRCGMCSEVCPVSLLPQQLYWYAQAEDYERLQAHNLRDCIECGACSYVCPSNIPLVQYYRAAKGTLLQREIERDKSDRARARFESRQARITRAEAEKEARRKARKKAAEQARNKLAATPGKKPDPTATGDVVAAAMVSANAQQLDPEKEQAKLQRAVTSLLDRVDKLEQKLATADTDQKDKLSAQLKQAQLKLAEAQAKSQTAAVAPPSQPQDAAASAIEKAQARAAAQAQMSPQQKLLEKVNSLETRLQNARSRLAQAEADNDANLSAFQTGVEKTAARLEQARSELESMQ